MTDYRLFIKVHNGFPEHRKTVGLSDRAFRVVVEMWCYCSRNLTDGLVPKLILDRVSTKKVREELINATYLEERSDGYEMVGYLEHQMSAHDVADLRSKRAESGRKGGQAKAHRVASATAVATPVVSSKRLPDVDVDVDVEKDVAAAASDLPREDVQRVCEHLADRVEQNGSKRPAITKSWRTEARLLIDRDKRSPEQVIKAIDYSQDSTFWRAVVLSMPKLREKYDQLRLAAEKDNKPQPQRGARFIDGAPGQMRMEQ